MRGRVTMVVFGILAILVLGLLINFIGEKRIEAARASCLNNLRMHGQAATDAFGMMGAKAPVQLKAAIPGAVPAGTLFVADRPPEDRLSWIADTLGSMNQSKQPLDALVQQIDRKAKWDAGANAEVGNVRLKFFTCPGNIPDTKPNTPAVTQYVGLAGVGLDAATLPLDRPISPKAGCFRYDSPTPFALIQEHDGLDNTLLFGEVSVDLGPWMRGGVSTVRSFDDTANAKPPVGFGGQFGGNHPEGVAAVGYASGSAKFITSRISPEILRAMMTIAGGDAESLPDRE